MIRLRQLVAAWLLSLAGCTVVLAESFLVPVELAYLTTGWARRAHEANLARERSRSKPTTEGENDV